MPNPYLAVVAIIAGVAIMQLAGGLIGTFVPLELAETGFSNAAIGLVAAVYSLGFLIGCLIAPRVIRSVGHIRAFAVFAAALSVVTLAFALGVDPMLWGALRLAAGIFAAVQFTVAESWLNDRTPRAVRGRVLSVYSLSAKVALVAGPLLLTLGGEGLVYFMLGSACYSLALVPVAMTRTASPPPPEVMTLRLGDLYRMAPAAMIGCLVAGLVNSAVISLSPAYAVQVGLEREQIGWLIAAMQVGSLVLQWPLGWLSDRVDRRAVIAGVSAAGALAALVAPLAGGSPVLLMLVLAVWGGFALSIYAVCVAHANDHAHRDQMVGLSSSLLLTWAVGSTVGPTLAAGAMRVAGPGGLYVYAAFVMAGLTGFVLWRRTRRPAPPAEARERFVNVPATSPAVAALDPRAPAGAEPANEDRGTDHDEPRRWSDYAI